MISEEDTSQAEDFCAFLANWTIENYKIDGVVVTRFFFSAYESGDYGEEGWIDAGWKTELTWYQSDGTIRGVDNEDLSQLMTRYFSG